MLSYKGRSKWKSRNFTTLLKVKKTRSKISKRLVLSVSDIGKIYKCYIGNKYVSLRINEKMVGSIIGQFLFTKKLGSSIHTNKKKKKR